MAKNSHLKSTFFSYEDAIYERTDGTKYTLRRSLSWVKIPTPQEEKIGVIYRIPCECGTIYIGKTGRTLKTRIAEHKRAVMNRDTNNALACHYIDTGHRILWLESHLHQNH